jgi:alkylhydroperoxidase family enzyme
MSGSAALTPLSPHQWPSSLRRVLEDMNGRPINVHGLMAHHPALLDAWWNFRNYTVKGGSLAEREREIVILAVARHLRNDYEWQSHVDRGIAAGLSGEEIESIRSGGGDWEAREAILLRAVHSLLTRHSLPEALQSELRRHFTAQQVLDVIFIQGAYVILGCLLNTFDVPIDANVSRRLQAARLPEVGLTVRDGER